MAYIRANPKSQPEQYSGPLQGLDHEDFEKLPANPAALAIEHTWRVMGT